MISFFNSSKVYPTASFAATFAIGNPVALEAKADDLETLGFISIITILPFFGLIANWTLDPPVSTPIFLKQAIEAFLITWYSLSVKVSAGAIVTESPVCMPIGSTFSIEQIIIQLSFLSLTTSISNSFQPSRHSSTKTWLWGDSCKPSFTILKNSFLFLAIPPPNPPNVKDGRIIAGKPIFLRHLLACSNLFTISDFGRSIPMSAIFFLNFFRSSAFAIAFEFAPINSILYFLNKPIFSALMARFNAVWPPIVGRIASGFSFLITSSKTLIDIGSI